MEAWLTPFGVNMGVTLSAWGRASSRRAARALSSRSAERLPPSRSRISGTPPTLWASRGPFPSVTTLLVVEPKGPRDLVTDDIDGDGVPDVTVLFPDRFSVFRSRGDGTFAEPVETPVSTGDGGFLRAADVDGNASVDVITASRLTADSWGLPGRINVFLNAGGGGFSAPVIQPPNVLVTRIESFGWGFRQLDDRHPRPIVMYCHQFIYTI